VPGVTGVGYANWFQGIYKDPKNFFAQFAVSGELPEYLPRLPAARRSARALPA
jgi:putative ABC transport system permease protein